MAASRRAAGTAQGACAASPALRLLRQRRGAGAAGAAAMGTKTGSGTGSCPPGLGLLLVAVVVVLLGEARAQGEERALCPSALSVRRHGGGAAALRGTGGR